MIRKPAGEQFGFAAFWFSDHAVAVGTATRTREACSSHETYRIRMIRKPAGEQFVGPSLTRRVSYAPTRSVSEEQFGFARLELEAAKMAPVVVDRPPEVADLPPLPDTRLLVTQDDIPVDNIYVEKLQRLLVEPLYTCWTAPNNRSFLALANVGLFFAAAEPAIVPDMMLSLDVPTNVNRREQDNRSYFSWVIGKFPDVVVEIVSDRQGGEDTDKMRTYRRLHIPYYVIYDPEECLGRDLLRAYALDGMKYKAIDPSILPEVGLGLKFWSGRFEGDDTKWLRWYDASGKIIPTGKEAMEQEKQRAEQEKQRAEQEKQRADAIEETNRRLVERLRQLGEPVD
jgi:Uma2 family endonuclease